MVLPCNKSPWYAYHSNLPRGFTMVLFHEGWARTGLEQGCVSSLQSLAGKLLTNPDLCFYSVTNHHLSRRLPVITACVECAELEMWRLDFDLGYDLVLEQDQFHFWQNFASLSISGSWRALCSFST